MRQALIDISGKLDCLLIEVLQNRKQIEELDKSKIGVKTSKIRCVFRFQFSGADVLLSTSHYCFYTGFTLFLFAQAFKACGWMWRRRTQRFNHYYVKTISILRQQLHSHHIHNTKWTHLHGHQRGNCKSTQGRDGANLQAFPTKAVNRNETMVYTRTTIISAHNFIDDKSLRDVCMLSHKIH